DRKADKQDGPHAEREAEDIDLADQVAQPDGEKDCQDRLGSDDIARKVKHGSVLPFRRGPVCPRSWWSTYVAPSVPELTEHPLDEVRRGRLRVGELVRQLHRLPLERAHLVER